MDYFPAKGSGARTEATERAKLMADEGYTIRQIVDDLMERHEIAESTAYRYQREGKRALGIETVDEQLVLGMLATRGASRCAVEAEQAAREISNRAESIADLDIVSNAFARASRCYCNVAQAAIKLDVGEMVRTDREQAEILARALITNKDKLPSDLRDELAAAMGAIH